MRKLILTSKKINEIAYFYYEEKLNVRETAAHVDLTPDVVKRVLNEELNSVRTQSEANAIGRERYGEKYVISKLGEKNPSAKLTSEQVKQIRKEYENGINSGRPKIDFQHQLATKHGVSYGAIRDIVYRITWKSI